MKGFTLIELMIIVCIIAILIIMTIGLFTDGDLVETNTQPKQVERVIDQNGNSFGHDNRY